MSDGKLFIDQIMALNATVNYTDGSNDGTVTWLSSDPTIASVTSTGVLTGVSGGVVTISATSVWPDINGNNIVDEKTLVVEEKLGSQAIYTFEYSGVAGEPPSSSTSELEYLEGEKGEMVPTTLDWPEFEGEPNPSIYYLQIDQINTNSNYSPDINIIFQGLRPYKNYRIKVVLDGIVSFIINEMSDGDGIIRSHNEHPYIAKESFSELTQGWTNFSGTMDVILISEW